MRHLLLLAVATTAFAQDPVPAPKGALVLFDGQSTEHWIHRKNGGACRWKVENGAMQVVRGTSDILSKKHFTDFQLHVEFWLPKTPEGTPWQGRSNSGVYLQGRYEVQVLDSYGVAALKAGDCGGIYGQKPADRNAARPPETWQTYDIHFTAPRFKDGKRVAKPRMTVFWNGVRIHDDVAIEKGTTANAGGDPATPGPILLQDHGNPVRYRNVWVIEKGATARTVAKTTITTPKLFADHMVLQRNVKTPIWGKAAPESDVTIKCSNVEATARSDDEGRFRVALPPQPAGGPHQIVITCNDAKHVIKDVLVGEVWICSGQSNMRWRVRQAANAKVEIANANHPTIRLASLKETTADAPAVDAPITWAVCSPETIREFSAVGYYFGRHLKQNLGDVPIGLIMTSWGGTPVEAWTSVDALGDDPVVARWDYIKSRNTANWKKQLDRWNQKARVAAAEGKAAPKKPRRRGPGSHHRPGALYNGMIAPLVPYAFRGAIWYQGESNADRAWQYRRLFQTMIKDWRKRFDSEFPFIYVELANFKKQKDQPADSDWAELREAQAMAMKLPKVGMACAIDIGVANDIHPKNKQEVGRRLALVALSDTYGRKNTVSRGPVPMQTLFESGKATITFAHAAGLTTRNDGALKGFAIAGKDQKWHWATATIDGTSVTLKSDAVENPAAVRYAWADNPSCNLINGAGLPAPPFRTDDWKGITDGRER